MSLLAGIHDPTMLGREFEIDVRTFHNEWMEPGREVSCEHCRERGAAAA